jgi:hypothetical protein
MTRILDQRFSLGDLSLPTSVMHIAQRTSKFVTGMAGQPSAGTIAAE